MKMVLGALVISIIVGSVAFVGLLSFGVPVILAVLGYALVGAATTVVVLFVFAQMMQSYGTHELSDQGTNHHIA